MALLGHSLCLNGQVFNIPPSMAILNKFKTNIGDQLLREMRYNIQANVPTDTFHEYFNYLTIENYRPEITMENIHDFRRIHHELSNDNSAFFFNPEYDYWDNIHTSRSARVNQQEMFDAIKEIAKHLDFYLEHYRKEMYDLPFKTLYAIFYHNERVLNNHNLGYDFVTKQHLYRENVDNKLFSLLPSLDGTKLSSENRSDAITHAQDHFGFLPVFNEIYTNSPVMERFKEFSIAGISLFASIALGRFIGRRR